MAIELHPYEGTYPSTSCPERERILEIRFAGDEGINLPTFAVVDLVDSELPENLDAELKSEIRRHMGRANAMQYVGYEDVTDELNDEDDATMTDYPAIASDNDEDTPTINLTGRIIEGQRYIGMAEKSGRPYDTPAGPRGTVILDGETYERTVYERRIWYNMKPHKLVARFVIIDNVNYEVE